MLLSFSSCFSWALQMECVATIRKIDMLALRLCTENLVFLVVLASRNRSDLEFNGTEVGAIAVHTTTTTPKNNV